jgi:Zinc finger, C2H2 type
MQYFIETELAAEKCWGFIGAVTRCLYSTAFYSFRWLSLAIILIQELAFKTWANTIQVIPYFLLPIQRFHFTKIYCFDQQEIYRGPLFFSFRKCFSTENLCRDVDCGCLISILLSGPRESFLGIQDIICKVLFLFPRITVESNNKIPVSFLAALLDSYMKVQVLPTGYRKFACVVCHKAFNKKDNLKNHVEAIHIQMEYRCTYPACDKVCKSQPALRGHIRAYHEKQDLLY